MNRWSFPDIPINHFAKDVVEKHVLPGDPKTKSELLDIVLARHDVAGMLLLIRKGNPGWGWDEAITQYIWDVLGDELHRQDNNGIRIYQCWPTGTGSYYWEPFSAFDLPKLQMLKRAANTRRRQAEMAGQRLDLWMAEVQKRGGTAGDVYPIVVRQIQKAS